MQKRPWLPADDIHEALMHLPAGTEAHDSTASWAADSVSAVISQRTKLNVALLASKEKKRGYTV